MIFTAFSIEDFKASDKKIYHEPFHKQETAKGKNTIPLISLA